MSVVDQVRALHDSNPTISHDEAIAALPDCNPATVKTELSRARKAAGGARGIDRIATGVAQLILLSGAEAKIIKVDAATAHWIRDHPDYKAIIAD